MAIATRRLHAPPDARLTTPDRSTTGVRRRRLDSVAPSGPDSREAQRRLMEAAVEAGDLAATIAAIAGLTRAAAVLQDPFLAVLASAPPPGEADEADPSAASAVDSIALTRSGCPLVRDLLRVGAAPVDTPSDAGARRPPLVELPKHGTTPPRLVAPVTARGDLLGFLVVAAVDRVAYATLEAAAPVIALLLQAEERLCRLLDRDQRELFLDLLAGRSADCLVKIGRAHV